MTNLEAPVITHPLPPAGRWGRGYGVCGRSADRFAHVSDRDVREGEEQE